MNEITIPTWEDERENKRISMQYCWDFNEQGYCKSCGQRATPEPAHFTPLNGKWPTNTWFQKRRLEVAARELSKVQS